MKGSAATASGGTAGSAIKQDGCATAMTPVKAGTKRLGSTGERIMQKHLENPSSLLYNYTEVKCDCGKVVAYQKGDTLYLYCKKCKKQIPVKIKSHEP